MSLPWPRPSGPSPSTPIMRMVSTAGEVFNLFGERTAEAIELIEKAIRLNPRYPSWFAFDSRLGLQLGGAL